MPDFLILPKGKSAASTSDTNIDLLNATSITTTKLYGKNYLQWSSAVKTFLISKEKLKYIEQDMPEETSSDWVKEDAQVRSWHWNLMGPHISCDVVLLPIAYAVWTSASESFASEANIQGIYGLCKEVFLTKQGTKTLGEYYSFVIAKWEELTIYQSLSN